MNDAVTRYKNKKGWIWDIHARKLFDEFEACKCSKCKSGGAICRDYETATTDEESGQKKHGIHLQVYCATMGTIVFDNATKTKQPNEYNSLKKFITDCDFFDDSPDDDE